MRLKTAERAPIPKANISIATIVKPQFRSSIRAPNLMSFHVASNKLAPRRSRHSSRTLWKLPKRLRASRAASSGVMPAAIFSAVRCSRWKRNSSSISCLTARCRHHERNRFKKVLKWIMVYLHLLLRGPKTKAEQTGTRAEAQRGRRKIFSFLLRDLCDLGRGLAGGRGGLRYGQVPSRRWSGGLGRLQDEGDGAVEALPEGGFFLQLFAPGAG